MLNTSLPFSMAPRKELDHSMLSSILSDPCDDESGSMSSVQHTSNSSSLAVASRHLQSDASPGLNAVKPKPKPNVMVTRANAQFHHGSREVSARPIRAPTMTDGRTGRRAAAAKPSLWADTGAAVGSANTEPVINAVASAIATDSLKSSAARGTRRRPGRPRTVKRAQLDLDELESAPVSCTQHNGLAHDSAERLQFSPRPAEGPGRGVARPTAAEVTLVPARLTPSQTTDGHLARHRCAGSNSDTDRLANEPALRRKLGDISVKFENLQVRYHDLKNLASTQTHEQFDKMLEGTEQRARDQDRLIAALRHELENQKNLVAEARELREAICDMKSKTSQLVLENKSLSENLKCIQNENRSLFAKLASRVPSENNPKFKNDLGDSGACAIWDDRKIMKLKEDMYSDLTGLIIRDIKRDDRYDVYDCLQTGRNGTLRFNLSVLRLPASVAPAASSSYEDIEFVYTPLLDAKNDGDLVEILPDYFTEQISFSRNSAAKFYAKISDCMTKIIEFGD